MSTVATPPRAPSEAAAPPVLQRRLGLFDATMLVAGTMIGSGIFIVSHDIAADVGSSGWLLGIWILTGVMTVAGALSYAELASMMPNAGGQYVYLRDAYSPLWGFLYGWTCFLVIQTGSIAAVGVALGKFLGVLVPELGTDQILFRQGDLHIKVAMQVPWMEEPLVFFKREEFTISAGQLVAVVVVLFLTLLNCRGVREGKWVQNIFTVAKTAGLIMLIVLGLTVAVNHQAIAANTANLWAGMWETGQFTSVHKIVPVAGIAALMVAGGAMVGSLFAADAWNNVTFTGGEVRNPRRNLPLSLVMGTGMVIFLYLLANLAYLSALPVRGNEALADQLKAELASGLAAASELEAEANLLQARASRQEAQAKHLESMAALEQRKGEEATDKPHIAKWRMEAEVQAAEAAEAKARAQGKRAEAEQAAAQARANSNANYAEATYELGIDHARDDRVGTAVLQRVSPSFGVPLMAIAIIISTFGCVNGMILMGARLYYAMAQDGLFFQSVGHLNRKGVPAAGLILQGLWSVLLIFSGTYGDLLDFIIFAALLFYVLTVIGLFVLRWKQPNAERPYRVIGYPVLPLVYVILCAAIMLDLLIVKPVYSWPSFIIMLSGIPVYFLWRLRTRSTAPVK